MLGLNSSQLAHSVSALYGTKFDGHAYLKRFVDIELGLPAADRVQLVRAQLDMMDSEWGKDLIPLTVGQPVLRTSADEMLGAFFDLI